MEIRRSGWGWVVFITFWGLVCPSMVQAAPAWVEVGEAPTSDLALTLRAIQSARRSLKINAYELTSTAVAQAIHERVTAGVQVDILQEGEPVPTFPAAGIPIRNELELAIKRAATGSYREMEGRKEGVRRFPYDHAKYIIVDNSSVLIGSENYSPTGQPDPGTTGNRGWEVFIHDTGTAADFSAVFSGDRNKRNKDISELVGFDKVCEWLGLSLPVRVASPGEVASLGEVASPRDVAAAAPERGALQATSVIPVISPDTSLNSLVSLIRSARRTLDIEQLNFDSDWDKVTNASPIFAEVVAAARRGVQVRVLLNDDVSSFGGDPEKSNNVQTVAAFQQYSRGGRVQAKIANLKAIGVDYIHNKGVLVDGYLTLISSINWNENSITRNREAGVILTSPQINAYYSALFNHDWQVSN